MKKLKNDQGWTITSVTPLPVAPLGWEPVIQTFPSVKVLTAEADKTFEAHTAYGNCYDYTNGKWVKIYDASDDS